MRLVECIGCKLPPVSPDFLEYLGRMTVLSSALHELFVEGLEHIHLLLSHRLAQLVCLSFRETGNLLGNPHHLLLVHGDSIGLLQEFPHSLKVEGDRLETLFPCDKIRDIVHRSGSVEGVHRNEVLKPFRMELDEPFPHLRGFELEHALGVSARIQLICFLVVNRYLFYVYVLAIAFLDKVEASFYDGKRLEPEEVHLQHSDLLDVGAFVLGYPHILVGGLVLCHRDGNVVGKVAASDDHRAGMYTRLPHRPFKGKGIPEHLLDERSAVFVLILELGDVFDAVLQLRLVFLFLAVFLHLDRLVRNHLRQAVGLFYREPAYACHVLYGTLGGHRTECDDVGHMVHPVFVLDILDDLVASVIVEINIDIRHRNTLRIEETLKEQVILDRVQIGDFQAVSHHRTGS